MRKKRVRGGGSSAAPGHLGPGFVVLCLWVGLATVPVAGAPLRPGKITPSHGPGEGIKNVQLIVPFTGAPANLRSEGELKLIPQDGDPGETLTGTYTAGSGKLTAKFNVERGLTKISYTAVSILPSGPELQIAKPVDVDAVKPKEMKIALDPASTTDEILTFHALVTEVPSKDAASSCKRSLYFVEQETSERVDLKSRTTPQSRQQTDGLSITFQFDRPSNAQPIYDMVLELCDGADQWVYRGGPVEIVPLQSLEILPQKRTGAAQTLLLEIHSSPDDLVQRLDARILDGIDTIPELRKGKQITFERQGDLYSAEVPVTCSSQEIELSELRITAKDDKNRQYLLKSRKGERICTKLAPPGGIGTASLLRLTGATVLIGLAVCAFVYRHKIRGWVQRGRTPKSASQNPPAPPTPPGKEDGAFPNSFPGTWRSGLEDILNSQFSSLYNTLQEVRKVLIQVRNHQLQSPGIGDPTPAYDRIDGEEQRGSSASPYSRRQEQSGDTLTNLVSRWWADGADRDRLNDLVLQNPSLKPYRSFNVQDSMRSTTNRTFLFQPTEGLAEWLGRAQQGELVLVPGDPKLFETGDSLKFLGVLFDGLGSSLSDVRFRRVLKACRLRKETGFTDRYRVAERGLLEVQGGPTADTFTSPPSLPQARASQMAPAVQKSELAEVVRHAVGEAMPFGLTNQIQDLSRQIRDLAQVGARQGSEPPRQDPNITAALAAVRQDLSALGQRMNAIEDMARVVEALRGSLARIEGELREIRDQQPLSAPPTVPPPAPALPDIDVRDPDIDVRDARSEPWLEEIREELKDAIPPSYSVAIPDPSETPEQLWARLQRWWPVLNGRIPDGFYAEDSSAAYLWSLDEARRTLSKAIADRGWQIDVVHVKVPDNSPAGEQILQIHEPLSVHEQRVLCACVPTSPFVGALLFQFALRVRGDHGQDIAVLPAPGLRLTGSTEGYARLASRKLPENATSLTEVLRPAILSQAGSGDLYTVVLPMQAKFR